MTHSEGEGRSCPCCHAATRRALFLPEMSARTTELIGAAIGAATGLAAAWMAVARFLT